MALNNLQQFPHYIDFMFQSAISLFFVSFFRSRNVWMNVKSPLAVTFRVLHCGNLHVLPRIKSEWKFCRLQNRRQSSY